MKKVIAETYLPVFQGFYQTIHGNGMDLQMEQIIEEYGGEYDDYEFDFETYMKEYSELCCSVVENELRHDFKSIEIIFQKLYSPKYYNYRNDSINCKIILKSHDWDMLVEYVEENSADFESYLKSDFTSRPGFISHYPNDYDKWIKMIKRKEKMSFVMGYLLNFYLDDNDFTVECLDDNVTGNLYLDWKVDAEE